MGVVGVGDDLCVRSAYGPDNDWYRRAKQSGAGRTKYDRYVLTGRGDPVDAFGGGRPPEIDRTVDVRPNGPGLRWFT
jgi:hypothetical protein